MHRLALVVLSSYSGFRSDDTISSRSMVKKSDDRDSHIEDIMRDAIFLINPGNFILCVVMN